MPSPNSVPPIAICDSLAIEIVRRHLVRLRATEEGGLRLGPQLEGKAGQLFDEVELRLATGFYRFGCEIVTGDLVEEFSASRAPVTMAMNLLQAASYVTIRPQVGIWVVSPSDEEITDFFTLYARSESLHTANATRRGSAEALEVLGVIADQIAAVGEPASPASGREQLVLSSLFHGLIRSMAATPWLCQHSASAWRMSNFLNANRPSLAAPSRCSAEDAMRRDIIAAMKTGDAKAAGALMEAFVMSRCTLPHPRSKRAGGVP